MYQHLLVPIDGSELSVRAAHESLSLAAKLGARVTGFVVEPMPPMPIDSMSPLSYSQASDEHCARTQAHAQTVLAGFAALAAAQGVPFDGQFKCTDAVDKAIVEAAAEFGCDLVVMVTHGRGAFSELFFGSHTKNVISRSKLPLLVLH
ncbi:MAG: universal stress protein [Rubrivivax sp.]|nr:universal stress protein [Rubrivivax sp.]